MGVGIKLFFLYLLVGIGLTITAGWNAALLGWTSGDPSASPDHRGRSADLRASRVDNSKHRRVNRRRRSFAQSKPRLRNRDGRLWPRPNCDEPVMPQAAESGAPSASWQFARCKPRSRRQSRHERRSLGVNPSDGADALKPSRVRFGQFGRKPNGAQSATVPLLNSLSKPFRPLCCESRRLGQIDDILQTDGPKNRGGRPVTIAVLSAHELLRYASPWTIKRVQMHVQRQGWSGIRQGIGENSNSRSDLMRLGQGSPDRHTRLPLL